MPHCKKTPPTRPSLIAERTRRFLSIQSSTAHTFLTLDYDILFLIISHLSDSTPTLKSLTHLLGPWRFEAQRRLLHVIDYHAHICTSPEHNPYLRDTETLKQLHGEDSRIRRARERGSHYYFEVDEMSFKCCAPEQRRVLYRGLKPTFVKDVRVLCELLRVDWQLARFVQHAFLRRDADSYEEVDVLVRQLEKMGSLESLHLTGLMRPAFNFNSLRQSSPSYTPVLTSLHIDCSIPSVSRTLTPRHLLALFQTPNLTSLHISHFPFNSLTTWHQYSAPRSSPITSLTLTSGIPSGPALHTILSWIRTLTHLHISLTPSLDFNTTGLCLRSLFTHIAHHHASTLTHLHLGSLTGGWAFAPSDDPYTIADTPVEPITLADFPALKHADILFCALARMPPVDELDDTLEAFFRSIRGMKRFFPQSLETLVLRLDESFRWTQQVRDPDPMYPRGFRPVESRHGRMFLEWLGELAHDVWEKKGTSKRKKSRFPSLKKIMVLRMSGRGSQGCEQVRDEHVLEKVWGRTSEFWAGHGVELEMKVRQRLEKEERGDVGMVTANGGLWPEVEW